MNAKNWLALFGLAVMWGVSFFFVELALTSFTPLTLVFLRVVIAAALILPLLGVANFARAVKERWRLYAFVGFFGSALPFTLFAWGQQYIESGLASLLNTLTPVIVFIFTLTLGREKFNTLRAVGIILGVVGVALLLDPDAGETKLLGALAGVAAAVAYAISTTFAWGKLRHLNGTENACGQFTFAALFLLPLALLEQPWQAEVNATGAMAVLGLALFSSFCAQLLYYYLLSRAGAVNTMLSLLLVPVVSVALGAVFLDERFGITFFIGGAFIFIGLFLIDEKLRGMLKFGRKN